METKQELSFLNRQIVRGEKSAQLYWPNREGLGRLKPNSRDSKWMHPVKTSSCENLFDVSSSRPLQFCSTVHLAEAHVSSAQLKGRQVCSTSPAPRTPNSFALRASTLSNQLTYFSPCCEWTLFFLMGNRADLFHLSTIMRNR